MNTKEDIEIKVYLIYVGHDYRATELFFCF